VVNWPIKNCVAVLQRSSMIARNKLALVVSSSSYIHKKAASNNSFFRSLK